MERTTKGMTRVKNAVEGRKETRRNEEKVGKGMSARGKMEGYGGGKKKRYHEN